MLALLAGSAPFIVHPLLSAPPPAAVINVRAAIPVVVLQEHPLLPVLPVHSAFHRHSAGDMTITCPHCSARYFVDEAMSCCAHGSVELPLWRSPPEPLLSLLQDENFRLKIRGYNCALSLGSSVFDDRTNYGFRGLISVL